MHVKRHYSTITCATMVFQAGNAAEDPTPSTAGGRTSCYDNSVTSQSVKNYSTVQYTNINA